MPRLPEYLKRPIIDTETTKTVITSVTRDDLLDGGAEHFKNCIEEIRKVCDAKIEILTPDFRSKEDFSKPSYESLDTIITACPDVFNHNIETVRSVFKTARPQGDYDRSLEVLKYVKENSDIVTKSGLMVGLGETKVEIEETFSDLKDVGVDILTVGQYIQPSKQHLPVTGYYTLEEFEDLKALARKVGFKNFQIGPLVRSSYHAKECYTQN